MAGTMSLRLQESAIIEDVLFTMMVWTLHLMLLQQMNVVLQPCGHLVVRELVLTFAFDIYPHVGH